MKWSKTVLANIQCEQLGAYEAGQNPAKSPRKIEASKHTAQARTGRGHDRANGRASWQDLVAGVGAAGERERGGGRNAVKTTVGEI